ncbi:MAG: hypothetical protein LBE31_01655 [Deltaproteobacteria bacterium]|jgi:hypothetical protein|nr:hypothetical protein [Deltaproteobacteria bacterium]
MKVVYKAIPNFVFFMVLTGLMTLLALTPGCLSTSASQNSAPQNPASSGSSKPPKSAVDLGKLKVHSGQVSAVSESEYVLKTQGAPDSDFYEAYFDVPVSLDKPFIIKLEVDYPARDPEDTVEIFIGDNSFGYQPAMSSYWNDYYASLKKQRIKNQSKIEIEDFNFGRNTTLVVNGVDAQFDKDKNYYCQVFMNYLVYDQYTTPYEKNFRFGVKVRSKNGQSKTATVSKVVFLGSKGAAQRSQVLEARHQLFDELAVHIGHLSEYYEYLVKQSKFGGNSIAEIKKNERAHWDERWKQFEN